MASLKRCTSCGQEKDLETGFHRKANAKDGRCCVCRECRNAESKQWREANPHYSRHWRNENREYMVIHQQAYRERRAQDRESVKRAAETFASK